MTKPEPPSPPSAPAPLPPACEFHDDELILRFDEVIPADLSAIAPLVDRVLGLVRDFGCAEGEEHTIELSLQEALANAVLHGAGGDPSKRVAVSVACEEDRGILIVVRDPGPGFDPRKVPSPVIGENVFESHGRGIFLINRLMDHVEFAHGGTEIRMRKNPAEPPGEPSPDSP
jgi:serine/threonine-protein kinase RsbW